MEDPVTTIRIPPVDATVPFFALTGVRINWICVEIRVETDIFEKLRETGEIESQTPDRPAWEICNFEKTDDSDTQDEVTEEEWRVNSLKLSEPLLQPKFLPTKNTTEDVEIPTLSTLV